MTTLSDLTIDGVLEIQSDGTAEGTKVLVDGKLLSLVQSIRLQITPDGVQANLVVMNPKLQLKGRIVALERADPATPAMPGVDPSPVGAAPPAETPPA